MDGAVREERTGIGRRARWLSLCVSITLAAGLAAGCRRAAPPPPPPAKDAAPAADAKAGGDKAGAGANTAAGEKGAPAADKKGAAAGDKGAAAAAAGKPAAGTAAGAKSAGAKGAGAKDTPFPSQAAGAAGTATPAGGAAKPEGAVQIVASAAAVGAPPAPAGAKPTPKEEIPGVPVVSLPQPARCPFRSEAKASFGPGKKRTAPAPAVVKPGTGPLAKPGSGPGKVRPDNPFGPLFPLPVGPVKPPSGATPPVAGPGPRVVEPAPTPVQPSLQLTGVIDGQPLMAILQGEKAHYIVQEGDAVPGGYRVASISLQRVVLHGRDRSSTVLRLGGKSG